MKQNWRRTGSKIALQGTAQEIARVAAKILAEDGVNDYRLAKQRAIRRLHLPENTALPSNTDVQQCLANHLELFDNQGLVERQKKFRLLAIQLMERFKAFQPLVVGAVVDGIITETSQIQLHVFVAAPEEITIALINENIPYELSEQQFRFVHRKVEIRPVFNLMVGDIPINLCVFSEKERRKPPLSVIDGKPQKRISLDTLKTSF